MVVQVNDQNRKNVGSIYIGTENSQVLNDTNITNLPESNSPSRFSDNILVIIVVVLLIIIVGTGYWFKIRK